LLYNFEYQGPRSEIASEIANVRRAVLAFTKRESSAKETPDMWKMRQTAFVLLAATALSGCATMLTSTQKREYQAYEAKGLAVEEKRPGAGAALGILPGGGSFYARAYGWGVVNLLLWPISVLWDPVSGYEGALAINYFATKAEVDSKMRKDLSQLDDQLMVGLVTKEDYVRQKHLVETKYASD
jgi:hypothetical protein